MVGSPSLDVDRDAVSPDEDERAGRAPCRVWIVDDVALDRERARRSLVERYEVRSFATSTEMLERLAAGPAPDVLVLDWLMPDVSGIDVSRYVRSLGHLSSVPILFLTGQIDPEHVAEGLAAGANDYLRKPFADVELLARVDALVRGRELLVRIERAERTLASFLDSSPDALVVTDAEGTIEYANPEALRALDLSAERVFSRHLGDVLPMLELDEVRRAAETAPRPLADIQIGDTVLEPTARTVMGGRLALALRDVTEQRRRSARRLDLYALVAHDLRSPLSSMLLRVQVMLLGRRGALPPSVAVEVAAIQRGAGGLVNLINDFLDLARMEGTAHELEWEDLDLSSLVETLCEELRPLAEAGNLDLVVDAPAGLHVPGDRVRIGQVVRNLLDNAIKFTPQRGTISVRLCPRDGAVELEIEDTGVGIAPDVLPHLFQRYVQGSGARGASASTGLGLLIVREIVESHGGTVTALSHQGIGTTIRVCLPA